MWRLLEIRGEIGPEIGPASLGLPDRPVHIVAKAGGAEQRQFHRLPIVGKLALRRLQHAFVNQSIGAQLRDRRLDRARRLQFGLRRIKVVADARSEEHTSELQSLMRISYAVFCLKKKNTNSTQK